MQDKHLGRVISPLEQCFGVSNTVAAETAPDLETSLTWLLAQVLSVVSEATGRALSGLPHGFRGYRVLSGAARGGARTQAELAHQLGFNQSAMVYLLDDLTKAGVVERAPIPGNRRGWLVRATPAGRARLASARAAIADVEADVLGALPAVERTELGDLLRMLLSQLSQCRTDASSG